MKSVIFLSYHSYKDPLFHGLLLQYLIAFQKEYPGQFLFHILTQEQKSFALSSEEKNNIHAELKDLNILWYPQTYVTGGALMLVKKGFSFLETLLICTRIRIQYKTKAILGFLALAGGLAYLISRFLRLQLITFCFEPHSDYLIDFGDWSPTSFRYKLTAWTEKQQVMKASHLTVPTRHTVDLVTSWNTPAKVHLLPISVDTNKFVFQEQERVALRKEIGAGNRKVLLYLGKFGGLYYPLEKVAVFFSDLIKEQPKSFFYVISTSPKETVEQAFLKEGLSPSDFYISGVIPYQIIEKHLSAADFGLIAIPPLPSQKYRTPIKTGNYLSCGLPVVTNSGVSDEDDWLEKEQVGIVIPDFSLDSAKEMGQKMQTFDAANQDELRQRCREAAIRHRGLHRSKKVLEEILQAL